MRTAEIIHAHKHKHTHTTVTRAKKKKKSGIIRCLIPVYPENYCRLEQARRARERRKKKKRKSGCSTHVCVTGDCRRDRIHAVIYSKRAWLTFYSASLMLMLSKLCCPYLFGEEIFFFPLFLRTKRTTTRRIANWAIARFLSLYC